MEDVVGSKSKNGGGNGTKESVPLDDMMQVTLVAVYLVQRLGQPTLQEILKTASEKLGAKIHHKTLDRALKGASHRGIISINQHQQPGGVTVKVFNMKDVYRWKQPPEYAHIMDLLPVLLQTPEAEKIKGWFDKQEGAGKAKKIRGNIVDDYHAFRVSVMTLDPLLGSQIASQYTDDIRKRFRDDMDVPEGVEVDGQFQRDELTGEYVIPPDVLQGWFITNACRYSGLQDARGLYIAFAPARFRPHKPVTQYVLPVNSARGVSAPKPYEAIPSGQPIEINFIAPTKGVLTGPQYEKLFSIAGLRPRRGLSPARGRKFGRFIVTKFEDLGAVKETGIEYLVPDVPAEILNGEHGKYLRDAMKRLHGVSLSTNFIGPQDDPSEEPFPMPEE